ncbi:hypothetical protein ACQF36_37585 [Streptomyces sp. Marseille-Q5077]
MVRISEALGRDIATGAEAKKIYQLGTSYTWRWARSSGSSWTT